METLEHTERYLKWQVGAVAIGLAITFGVIKAEAQHMGAVVHNSHDTMVREREVAHGHISYGLSMRSPSTTGE